MAKSKKAVEKTPKKHSPKYSKIAATCSKELAAKKKALANAEKALAKAQKTHSELLSEVARLDMLDRSLKALINGTEPPQNVRYVYTYPHWVYGNQYWNWNGNTWTLSLGTYPQNSYVYTNAGLSNTNFQGGQFTTTNAVNTISTPVTTSGALSVNSGSGSLCLASNSNGGFTFDSNSGGLSNAVLTSTSAAPQWQTVTTTTNAPGVGPDLTVDLSTGAADPEAAVEEAVEKEEATTAEVGYGG